MNKFYSSFRTYFLLTFLFAFGLGSSLHAQINWTQSTLDLNGNAALGGVTSLMYGPDGRLYVAEYTGAIKILTIQRNTSANYVVTNVEILDGIRTIQDHDDDGVLNSSLSRQTTGITVGGTSANPIIYVTSSDIRIGAGNPSGAGSNGDVNLDTNSGVITRFTWNGSDWDVVDLVRGLPRSEENHSTNGLELTTINGTNYLIVANGGFTNGGSPSINFVYACEYALSGAILSVNLDAINALTPQSDNGRNYLYDLPTLDDPTRANINNITDPDTAGYDGIDVNDPFGGNDGLNQAVVVPGGPVQIFSPGFRNSYDIVITESGALYATDNGPNVGWGGFPENEGSGNVTNNYVLGEPGSQSASGGEIINNEDHLELITTNLQTYNPGSFYGGHPNPTRANPSGAGLYTAPGTGSANTGAVFRTLIYDPDNSRGAGYTSDASIALPANWPPIAVANPEEGDYRGPGIINPDGPDDSAVTLWQTNTNGIDEYTASNFGGQLQGNLLAGSNKSGKIRRVQLNGSGLLDVFTDSFINTGGGNNLGITCNSDTDVFPGTIWVGTFDFPNGMITVFEPADAVVCIDPSDPSYEPNADYDSDGYTNEDEVNNETDPCNGGSQPSDFDKALGLPFDSDLKDNDDDGDGILDFEDPFQLGNINATGSDAFTIPINNELTNGQQGLGGYLGLGMTGLMNNGDMGANWLNWLDLINDTSVPNPNDVTGGATGLMTSHMTSGTASGISNNQEKGYQYGIQTNSTTGDFTVSGDLFNLTGPLRLYGNTGAVDGELGHFIGDGTQSNYIKIVLTTEGITAVQEINDVLQTPINIAIAEVNRPTIGVVFYFIVDPANGAVELEYTIDGGTRTAIGTFVAQGAILEAIQQANKDLAVGFTGTSAATGVELEGTWGFLSVIGEVPAVAEELPDVTVAVNSSDDTINLDSYFIDDNGTGNLIYSVQPGGNPNVGTSISGNMLTLSYPVNPAVSTITIRATDGDGLSVDQTFTVTVTDGPIVLYRVNSGGDELAAIDGGLNWEADTTTANSQYLAIAGTNQIYATTNLPVDGSINQSTTPLAIFASERYDDVAGTPNMTYSFPVPEVGNYEVRLYFANSFSGTGQPDERIFNTEIEGLVLPLLSNLDIVDTYGNETGTVISHIIKVTDGTLDVSFVHAVIENPLINAIEILDAPNDDTPIYIYDVANQFNNPGQALDGSLGVNVVGGDGNPQYSATGLPPGVFIEPTNGQIGGAIDAGALAGSPYNVIVTVDDSDASITDTATTTFIWTIGSDVWVDKDENENYTARHECSLVQAGDKFYLMGGRENAQTVDVYDYTTNTWVNLMASAPKEFNHFQATEYQGLIWVIGAFGTNVFPNEVPEEFIWAFDPATNQWIQGPEIPVARRRGSTGLVIQNNKFYIVGGNTDGHDGGFVPWFDEYDPATGVWTPLVDAPRARDHFAATVIGNNLYLAGGRLSGGTGGVFAPTISEIDVYDFVAGTWSTLPTAQNLPTPRGGASSVNFDGKLVVIGGEVQNESVYGVNTLGALKITEAYDPNTQTWTRLSDLNFERHGTQAIVSGGGLFTLGGSNVLGGGNQKNMEFLGIDNPVGTPSVSSVLSAPTNIIIADGASEAIALNVGNGNVGVFVTAMEITGPNAADFNIISGALTNQLLSVNSSQPVTVGLSGTGVNRSAILTINYSTGQSTSVNLTNFDNTLNVSNPGTQNNNEGDVVSLQIQGNGANTYSASGLPPTLNIDSNTGLISGTVSSGGINDGPFIENNGLVVIEAESETLVPTWEITNINSATGIIAGSDHLNSINGGTIPYEITIATPGVYRFNWRTFYSGIINTDQNDNWLRFPNNSDVWFFGYQGNPVSEANLISNLQGAQTDVVFPKGSSRITATTTPEGAGGNGYFKIFRTGGTSEVYDWQALTSDFDGHDIYVYFENAGTFTMEISERSAGHAIDKVALYKVDGTNYTDSQLTNELESQRAIGVGAAVNSPYTVTVSVADGGNPPSTANTQFTWFIGEAGDPIAIAEATPISGFIPLEVNFTGSGSTDDIGITDYLWDFKDGSPTVTTADPVHTFTDTGTYEVELTVSDAAGNQSTTTVTVIANDPATAGDIRINAGGPDLSFNGVNWSADQYFNGGLTFDSDEAIANTANDALYQTERYSSSGTLIYEIPVVAGNYNVNLHFAELFFGVVGSGAPGGIGSRVFNINIENGQEVINNYDIVVEAGGSATTVIESFQNIAVNDGSLTISLTSVVEFPKISGIEVLLPGNSSAPEVFAGDDRTVTVPNTTLSLDGSATDPDGGNITSYLWTQVIGPTMATFSSTAVEDPIISDLIEGDYIFRLTATDEENDTAFDDVTITVAAEPGSLLINAGGPSFNFNTEEWIADNYFVGGSLFDDDRPIENTLNDQLYQTERFGSNESTLIYEIPVIAAGDYNVDLHFAELYFGAEGTGVAGGAGSRVFNINVENGQFTLDNYDIFVEAGNAPLTAVIENIKAITVNDGFLTITLTSVIENPKISGIGVFETRPPEVNTGANQTITLPTNTVALTGVATDPDGGAIDTYQWTQVSGPSIATLSGDTTTNLIVNDLVEGDYVFTLTVTDDENVTGFDEVMVTVLPESTNQMLTAIATADVTEGDAPLVVAFTGSNSVGAITSYSWDFGDGTNLSTEANPEHTYTAGGVFTATLTVENAEGETDMSSITITALVDGLAAFAESDVIEGDAPLVVTFTGSNSVGAITSYSWDFGDGTTLSTEADPQHIYTIPGVYRATLTVEDSEGQTSISSIVITVSGGVKVDIILTKNPALVSDGVAIVQVINKPENVEVLFITLHDVGGRYISGHLPQDIVSDPTTYEIPISNLRNGLYLIRVVMSQGDSILIKLMVSN